MKIRSFNTTVQGASHKQNGIVCQDASISGIAGKAGYAVVCDGHGGESYVRSNIGAEIGTETAKRLIVSFVQNINGERFFADPEKAIGILEEHFLENWRKKVNEHWKNNPFAKEELAGVSRKIRKKYSEGTDIESAYGTTVIMAVMTEEYWFAVQVGDGKCIKIDSDGTCTEPVPNDPRCFQNITTSLCDPEPMTNFRSCYSFENAENYEEKSDENGIVHFRAYGKELPSAIIISTDGVGNSFETSEKLCEFYKGMLCYMSTLESQQAMGRLEKYMNEISENGSQDDMSVAGIFNDEIISEWEEVKAFAKEAGREAEELRKAEEKAMAETPKEITETYFNYCPMCAKKLKNKSKMCPDCGLDLTPFISCPIIMTGISQTKIKKSSQRHEQQILQAQIQPPRKSKKEQIQSDRIPIKEKPIDESQEITEPIFSDIKINYDDNGFDGSIDIDPVPDVKTPVSKKKKSDD